jgi:hypothetical protein
VNAFVNEERKLEKLNVARQSLLCPMYQGNVIISYLMVIGSTHGVTNSYGDVNRWLIYNTVS